MSNYRPVRRPSPASRTTSEKSSGGKRKWIAAVILLLLMGGIAYAFLPSEDPALARIEAIRQQMDGATDEQRRELWGQMRQEFENLGDEAREQMREDWGQRREAREQEHLNEFFALSPQEQIKKLDEDIDREQEWRKRRAQRARSNQGQGNRGDGGRGGFGGPRGGRSRSSSDDPNARRKSYLDKTTPQSRAMRSEYRRMRDERRQQRGIS